MDIQNTIDQNTVDKHRMAQADRWHKIRLGFEAILIALCGYLIGVAGLPPLFDAPGRSGGGEVVTSSALGSDGADTVAAPTAVDAGVNATPGAGVSVTIGRSTWSTGYFQAALFRALLEELGYTVNDPALHEQGPTDAFKAMADGTIDFWANSWLPNHDAFIDEELGDGSMVGDHVTSVGDLLPAAGLEGVVVTRSVAEERGITSLDQINGDPALVELFDANGNGQADVYGCPDDWGCFKILNELIEYNGWTNIEQISDDYDAMVDQSAAQVDGGTAVLQYTWSPSGYLTRLRPGDNVVWLSIGGPDNMLDGSITPEYDFNDGQPPALGPACTADPCWLGWPAADIKVTARNDFLDANPAARVLFEQAQLKVLDVALANVKYDTGETSPEDLTRHAQEWITDNRPVVDQWLTAARAAG